jgi:hypothetical protein
MANKLTESYSSPHKTIAAVNEAALVGQEPPKASQHRGQVALSSVITVDQVHPMLWQYLKENGPHTASGRVDRSRLAFDFEHHVTPDSITVDSVIVYDSAEQKQAAEQQQANQQE